MIQRWSFHWIEKKKNLMLIRICRRHVNWTGCTGGLPFYLTHIPTFVEISNPIIPPLNSWFPDFNQFAAVCWWKQTYLESTWKYLLILMLVIMVAMCSTQHGQPPILLQSFRHRYVPSGSFLKLSLYYIFCFYYFFSYWTNLQCN